MTCPKISIVTPSYNQANFIPEAVKSVVTQEYPNLEQLVYDNCSTDGTRETLKDFHHLKFICERDQGQSDALNKGFKMAAGEIIGWLNADDRYLPGAFKTVADFFAANPSCDVLYGDYRLIDRDGKVLCLRREIAFDLFMLKYLHVLCIPSTATFFRRKIFEEGNFLDPSYHYAMDYEFFVRLALKGYRFEHCPHLLADFRTHPDSKSQLQRRVQKEEMEKASVELDPSLKNVKGVKRQIIRQSLMLAARSKRYGLKFIHGAYF